jgi:hypothetical protein
VTDEQLKAGGLPLARCTARGTFTHNLCRLALRLGFLVLGTAIAEPAMAQDTTREKLAAAFEEADSNGDGFINVDEYVAYMVRAFAGLDIDRDGYLAPADVSKTTPERFAQIDRDGDGRISLGEGVAEKMIDYFAIDTDEDGVFSFTELLAYEQKKSGS